MGLEQGNGETGRGERDRARRARGGARTRGARARGGRERGAVLVEAAIIIPLVLLLTFGVIEFARMFNAKSTVSQAARAGGRTASALPLNANLADQAAHATAAVLTRMEANAPQEVWIYRIDPVSNPDGSQPGTCQTDCVQYTWIPATQSFDYMNPTGSWDTATDMEVCTEPFDEVGVYVKANVEFITGLFGSARTLSDVAVFRFEPVSLDQCPG